MNSWKKMMEESKKKQKKKEMDKGTKKCGNNKNVDNSTSQEDDGIEKDTKKEVGTEMLEDKEKVR